MSCLLLAKISNIDKKILVLYIFQIYKKIEYLNLKNYELQYMYKVHTYVIVQYIYSIAKGQPSVLVIQFKTLSFHYLFLKNEIGSMLTK